MAVADLILITAKRVDSDETVETEVAVEAPPSELGRRAQLTDIVAGLYPNAEFRSFADDAATFLGHKLLIVALYNFTGRGHDAAEEEEDDAQEQLFAA